MENIIVAAITVLVPSITTLITSKSIKRQANKHSARESIMQLILEDHIRVMENKLPENRKDILAEYDEYNASGGNSYIHTKVDEYEAWYKELRKDVHKKEK